jgi:hypothetical protein
MRATCLYSTVAASTHHTTPDIPSTIAKGTRSRFKLWITAASSPTIAEMRSTTIVAMCSALLPHILASPIMPANVTHGNLNSTHPLTRREAVPWADVKAICVGGEDDAMPTRDWRIIIPEAWSRIDGDTCRTYHDPIRDASLRSLRYYNCVRKCKHDPPEYGWLPYYKKNLYCRGVREDEPSIHYAELRFQTTVWTSRWEMSHALKKASGRTVDCRDWDDLGTVWPDGTDNDLRIPWSGWGEFNTGWSWGGPVYGA